MATDRLPTESPRAYAAYCDYRDMGPQRSLEKVAQKCTKSVSLLRRWSSQLNWVKRASAHDTEEESFKRAARQAEIEKTMAEGYAQAHERIRDLNNLAIRLNKMLRKRKNIWLPDAKTVGAGEVATVFDFVRFNAPLIEQYRATLDDLAKETGGRVKKQEMALPAGTSLNIKIQYVGATQTGSVNHNGGETEDEPTE